MSSRTYLSIGDVLSLLRQEFPDITISKIRFLESQGLVNPERSPSGYRKFYDHDVERLRWVLRQQREHFLPLKVIRDRLVDQAGQPGGSGLQADPSGPDGSAEGAKAGAEVAAAGVAAAPQAALVAVASSAHTRAPERAEGQPAAPGPQDPGRSVEASPPAPGDAPAPANAATTNAPAGDAPAPANAAPPTAATVNAPAGDAPPGHAPAGGRGTSSAPGQAREVAGAPSLPGLREPGPGASDAGTGADLPSGVGVARAAAVPADPLPAAAPEAARAEDPGSQAGTPGRSEPLAGQGPAPPPPPLAGQPGPAARRGGADRGAHAVSLTPEELCAESGLSAADLAALEGFGLLSAATVAGVPYYDEEALDVARLLVRFSRYGIEPRHLRLYRNAVEREVGLVEQVVTPLLRQRNPEARQRAHEAAGELAELGERLRASLLRRELQRLLGT